ncbi:MAG TPA: DUF3187 family protein [Povalibacter sp.]|uniref:DUF3187 family protein n=1 Tax=Povalibacter sp. TaxID=1962978 RepID=UPI002C231808|nr:DUF3187 family protein [Povalibacter sp.]HMN45056.1 DUF3187 family protein [Povalibacter sp.]
MTSPPASADPFPTRDQNPLLAGFGIPHPLPSRLESADTWTMAADFNWGSSALLQQADDEDLLVDAETRELRLTLGRALSDRWTVQLQLPYRYTGAGSLDSFIDSWHDFFGLPEGERPNLPRDQFRIAYERDGVALLDFGSSVAGLGDLSANIGYQWLATADTHVAAWASLKLPTGDADDLTGSGAMDATLALAAERRFGERWSAFGQLAATYLGEGDLLPQLQRSVVWSGLAGIDVNVWRGLALKLQFDAHTAAFDDTGLDYLGDALILTVGGAWKFASGWQIDFGVSEDIAVETSPDVVFVLGLRR